MIIIQACSCQKDLKGQKRSFVPRRLQRSTFNVQRSMFNLEPATFNVQRSTPNVQPSTFNLQPSDPFAIPSIAIFPEAVAKILGGAVTQDRHHHPLAQVTSDPQCSSDIGCG